MYTKAVNSTQSFCVKHCEKQKPSRLTRSHASTANHDERDDQRKSHTLITDARCVLARVHLIRVLIIGYLVLLVSWPASTVSQVAIMGKGVSFYQMISSIKQNLCVSLWDFVVFYEWSRTARDSGECKCFHYSVILWSDSLLDVQPT